MRAAPAVQLDVEVGLCWRVALWALVCVAIAAAVGWALAVSTAVAWTIVALAAALRRFFVRKPPEISAGTSQ